MCVYSDAHVRSVVNPSLMFMQSGIQTVTDVVIVEVPVLAASILNTAFSS